MLPINSAGKTSQSSPSRATEPGAVKQRIEFPLVTTGMPGSLHLTSDRIHEILAEEDIEALQGQCDVSS
jgi:hypothetical protein